MILKKASVFFYVCLSSAVYAADVPQIVIQNNENSKKMCIERAANDCINTICVDSPDLNCTDKCQSDAESKCAAMVDE